MEQSALFQVSILAASVFLASCQCGVITKNCSGHNPNDVMVRVGSLCVDKYEASIWDKPDGTGTAFGVATGQTAYPASFPATGNWQKKLYAVSKPNVLPSTRVTWFQAQQACAASGKRLLTNAEWQMAAAGTPDPGNAGNGTSTCNTNTSGLVPTGTTGNCVSNWQVYDMVGNAWEWVADWSHGNTTPWAPVHATAGANYGDDWIYKTNAATVQGYSGAQNFPAAFVRGGGWQQNTKAGVFTLYADTAPSAAVIGPTDGDMGFRCGR